MNFRGSSSPPCIRARGARLRVAVFRREVRIKIFINSSIYMTRVGGGEFFCTCHVRFLILDLSLAGGIRVASIFHKVYN